MKKLINEFRRYVAAIYIQAAFNWLPNDNEYKLRFAKFNKENIDLL